MSPRFEAWKSEITNLTENEAGFEKWLFVHIAGVLFADKGGELLTLNAGNCRLSVERQVGLVDRLSLLWRYSHLTLCKSGSCARVVIYDPGKMRNALVKVPGWVLEEIDYHYDMIPRKFLEEMGRRWRRKGRIPHEIGLALGYPVKDVLGFIGLVRLKCTHTCGWRVYGDPGPSLTKSRRYRRAREAAEAFVGISKRVTKPGMESVEADGFLR